MQQDIIENIIVQATEWHLEYAVEKNKNLYDRFLN